jgi:hypothetical protein
MVVTGHHLYFKRRQRRPRADDRPRRSRFAASRIRFARDRLSFALLGYGLLSYGRLSYGRLRRTLMSCFYGFAALRNRRGWLLCAALGDWRTLDRLCRIDFLRNRKPEAAIVPEHDGQRHQQ